VICQCRLIYQRRTFCFLKCIFLGWPSTSRDVCRTRWFRSLSRPCYSWKQLFQPFFQRHLREGEQRLLYRHPASHKIYVNSVADTALIFEDTFSDLGVSFRNSDIWLLESSFLLAHLSIKYYELWASIRINSIKESSIPELALTLLIHMPHQADSYKNAYAPQNKWNNKIHSKVYMNTLVE